MNKILKTALKIAVPVTILVIVLIIKFSVTSDDTFSLVKYVTVTVSGVNGRGKATVSLDEVGLYAALAGSEATAEEKAVYHDFVESVSCFVDRDEYLYNEDEIVVTADYSEKQAEKLGIRIVKTQRTQTVAGLTDGTKLDLFADLQIITSGTSPFITLTYANQSENAYLKSLEYTISRTAGLAIGDTITISCSADETSAAAQGYYFDMTEMEYTIQTADYYINDPADFPKDVVMSLAEEDIAAVHAATEDTTTHMVYQVTGNRSYLFRDNNEQATGFAYYKSEMAYNATGYELEHENYLLIYLKGQIALPTYTDDEDPYDYVDAYFCFLYSDAIMTTDGEFLMASNDAGERFVCGASYEDCLQEARERIGTGYSYSDVLFE